MSDKEKSVVSFLIDDTPSAEQASKTFNDDYELNFQDFLERTVDERAAEDFFYSNNGVKKQVDDFVKKKVTLSQPPLLSNSFALLMKSHSILLPILLGVVVVNLVSMLSL